MKKKFILPISTALVVGVASTALAAQSPFSDLPTNHWAYEAVTKLVADGVIEGMGDGTFQGNRNITRYEAAQMVAKALAKNPTRPSDKATLNRLSAEFSEELNNLGVRVSELEKYADKVQWTGELRYRYWSLREEQKNGPKQKTNIDHLQIRLFPEAEVNNHWKLKARLTASGEMSKDSTGDFSLTYAYAEGTYDKFQLNVGRMPFYSYSDDGLVMDDFFSGAQVVVGSKTKAYIEAGRWNVNNTDNTGINQATNGDDAANYQGVEVVYGGSRLDVGAAYRHFNSKAFYGAKGYNTSGKLQDDADIWSVGLGYKFGDDVKLFGAYAKNPTADDYDKGYNVQLSYKGADKTAGSWGAYVAYRYVGGNVGIYPTYDVMPYNQKGVDFSLQWSPLKNTLTQINYFTGESLETGRDVDTLYARISCFF